MATPKQVTSVSLYLFLLFAPLYPGDSLARVSYLLHKITYPFRSTGRCIQLPGKIYGGRQDHNAAHRYV